VPATACTIGGSGKYSPLPHVTAGADETRKGDLDMATKYLVKEIADGDSSGGQDCGTAELHELPDYIRKAIEANPTDGSWAVQALDDTGEELDDLRICITRLD
jgi:hypothetical protein